MIRPEASLPSSLTMGLPTKETLRNWEVAPAFLICLTNSPRGFTAALQITASGLRSEEHTSELQSLRHLVCRLLLEKKKKNNCAMAHVNQTDIHVGVVFSKRRIARSSDSD